MSKHPALTHFRNFSYSVDTYFAELQKALDAKSSDDLTQLSTDRLAFVGTAVGQELDRIGLHEEMTDVKLATKLQEIEKLMDVKTFTTESEYVKDIIHKINQIGYSVRHGEFINHKEDAPGLKAEQIYFLSLIEKVAEKYEGEVQDKWNEYANIVLVRIHQWLGHAQHLNLWYHHLKKEFKTRQPGYEEKTLEEQMETDSNGFIIDDDDWFNNGEPDYTPSDDEIQIEHLTEAIHERDQMLAIDRIKYDRLARVAQEKLTDEQKLSIADYQDQLDGLIEEVNENWNANVDRLDAEGDLKGRVFSVYFNSVHPQQTLRMRYKQDLAGTAQWRIKVLERLKGNKFRVEQDFEPRQQYLMCLGKDDRNHIFAYNFLSFKGMKWKDAEDAVGPPKSKINQMTKEQLYEYYDKIDNYIAERKKRASG